MSKYMQIDIRLLPVYGTGGLPDQFPRLAKLLKGARYVRVLEEEPSLYHMVDVLIRIKNDPAVAVNAKRAVVRMIDQFVKVRDEAREHLLARRLNELDRALYRLEDLFQDLERELRW